MRSEPSVYRSPRCRLPKPKGPPYLARVVADIRAELAMREPLPPGEMGFSLAGTHRFQRDTLQALLDYHSRFGPIFAFRSLHRRIVGMIGPEANHFVTVTGAENFSWRKGMFGEQLTPLMGDGLITTDWEYHDRAGGKHPGVLARVADELGSTLGGRPPTVSDLIDELPYLSMVVDETLRLYPPSGSARGSA